MTRYAPFDNASIEEEYRNYLKDSIAKGNLMPLSYPRWLERRYARLHKALVWISHPANYTIRITQSGDFVFADIDPIVNCAKEALEDR